MNVFGRVIDDRLTILEIVFIFLCYVVGIGSIIFGSLSGNDYGYGFYIIGVLALVLVILHTARRAVQYNEIFKKRSEERLNIMKFLKNVQKKRRKFPCGKVLKRIII